MSIDHQADALRSRAMRPTAPMYALLGAKGGVGKTSLAVNLALLTAQSGQRVLLVDLDPHCGDVGVHLRLSPTHCLDDVLLHKCTIEQALTPGPHGIALLATGHGSELLGNPDAMTSNQVFAAIAEAARQFDVVICDTGAGIGALTIATAEQADLALAVTTSDPASVTDTFALYKVLHRRGVALPRLVVNAARSCDDAMRTAARLARVCERFLGTTCSLLAWLRRDEAFLRSVYQQQPLATCSNEPATAELRALRAAVHSLLPALPHRQPAPLRTIVLRPAVPKIASPAHTG